MVDPQVGPLAINFWNFWHFCVKSLDASIYRCSWNNGGFEPSQINWAIVNFSYQDIASRLEQPSVLPPQ